MAKQFPSPGPGPWWRICGPRLTERPGSGCSLPAWHLQPSLYKAMGGFLATRLMGPILKTLSGITTSSPAGPGGHVISLHPPSWPPQATPPFLTCFDCTRPLLLLPVPRLGTGCCSTWQALFTLFRKMHIHCHLLWDSCLDWPGRQEFPPLCPFRTVCSPILAPAHGAVFPSFGVWLSS